MASIALQCEDKVTSEAVLAVTQEQLRAVGLSNAKVSNEDMGVCCCNVTSGALVYSAASVCT